MLKADGKVTIVYKKLPILGEVSRIAAYAALAARKQGKHAALHKALMEFRGKIDRARILEIAASVGIDVPQLEKDMEEAGVNQNIEHNLALASALGVRGTPAFVIGRQFVPGAVDADTLRKLIAEARGLGNSMRGQSIECVNGCFGGRAARLAHGAIASAAPALARVWR